MKRNPSQKRAIAHLLGPMMVLAGPGSGKTSVIVERTAYMTSEGKIPPSSVLVVTFSRAAAKEMKERFLTFYRTAAYAGNFRDLSRRILWNPETGLWINCCKYSFGRRKIRDSKGA